MLWPRRARGNRGCLYSEVGYTCRHRAMGPENVYEGVLHKRASSRLRQAQLSGLAQIIQAMHLPSAAGITDGTAQSGSSSVDAGLI